MKRQRPENGHNKSPSKRGRQQQQLLQSLVGEWSESDHRDLVAAIFEIGLKHSSPSAILEFMAANEDLTVERIKSRLQKFRLKREESKAEFLSSYDETMARFKSDEAVSGLVPTYDGVRNQAAEPAAFLTHATIAEGSGRPLPFNPEPHVTGAGASGGASSSVAALSQPLPFGQNSPEKSLPLSAVGAVSDGGDGGGGGAANTNEPGEVGGAPLRLPDLSEEERNAPIGQSFEHLMGLFASLKDNLLKQRAEEEEAAAVAAANDGTCTEEAQNNGGTDELAFASTAAAASTAAHVTSGASHGGALVGDDRNANDRQYPPYPSHSAADGSNNAW